MPSPMLASGCRYCAPSLKHLLTFTLRHHRLPPPTATTVTGRFSKTPLNSLLFPTGNSKLSCMEVSCHLLWIYCAILAIFRWSYCSQLDDHVQPNTCLSGLDNDTPGIQLPVAPDVEAIKPEKYFWTGSNIDKNKGMIENMFKYGIIKSKKVVEVMETIDRALFVPDGAPPYVDSPMTIGYGATISAPHMHAMCLELFEDNLQPGMRVLDVGSGTEYLTACFAIMVGPQGRAIGVEHIPELVTLSIKNIERSAAAPLLKEGSLSLHVGDGREGWAEFAPYDAIHVGAAAPEIPQQLIDQLKPGGTMVIPVGNIFQDLKVVKKSKGGSVTVRTETSVRYVTLTSREDQLQRQ